VTEITDRAVVLDGEARHALLPQPAAEQGSHDRENHVLPIVRTWQEPVVKVGDKVVKKQLLARGITHIYFQANVWVFTVLVFVVGIAMGVGKAAVYKYIPEYYPEHVGVVGGLVGVIGGLGGFVSPIIFGTMLDAVGLWTTTWMFLFAVAIVCIVWLNLAIRGLPDRHEVST
jgi:NNP family nitrate/nitrite transporter-like MFS transporter